MLPRHQQRGMVTMAKLTDKMKDVFAKAGVMALATSTVDGDVNVVPIGAIKLLDDETVLISDQYFDKTLTNMRSNPRVAVTYWADHEGYQLKGRVTIETSGRRFEETVAWMKDFGEKIGVPLKSKGAVIMTIEDIFDITPGPGAGKKLA